MAEATRPKRGRPATGTREDVIGAARAQYMAGERVDLTVIARQLGLGRATLYRWFGSREGLLSEVINTELERLLAHVRRSVRRRGAAGLLEVLDRVNRFMAESMPLRRLLEQERDGALRLLTSSSGVVQPRGVALVTELIEAEVKAGRYDPPADPETLAYATVRLFEAFTYNDAVIGIRGDHVRLREVQAALLGIGRQRDQAARRAP